MSKVGEHLKHKTYVERDETVLEHAVDAHWTEGQSLLSHLPKKEGQALSFVPELAGACEATRSATAWKLSPRSSAQSPRIDATPRRRTYWRGDPRPPSQPPSPSTFVRGDSRVAGAVVLREAGSGDRPGASRE